MLGTGLGWWVLALAVPAWGQARPVAAPLASITGVVQDNATGAGVARAVVTLRTETAEPYEALAWADEHGAFAFARVPAGQYWLSASSEGYETARYGAVRNDQPPEVLALTPGEIRQVVLRMSRVGSISGTVTDADGDPLAGVNVRLLVASYNRRTLRYMPRAFATTDNRGRYRIGGLQPGKYFLMANAQAWPRPPAKAEVVRGQEAEESRYGTLFYPNADRISAAAPITLGSGANLEDFDLHLTAQAASRIEGKLVVPAETGPKAQIMVWVREEDGTEGGINQGVGVNLADYTFVVGDLLPGRYLVTASCTAEGRTYGGGEHVEVGRNPVSLTIRLEPGVDLAGSVRLEGDAGGERPQFRVMLVRGDGVPSYPLPEAQMKPDGTFRIAGVLPGVWDIDVEPVPKGGYIKSMRLGDRDVLRQDMTIGPETREPLNVVVSTRGAVVEGSVTGANQAYVVLAPAGGWENVWTFYQVAPADEKGHFEFKGVTPGAYRLYALDRLDTDPSQDPEFVKSLGERGEAIDVAEGGHVTRELRLIPETAQETGAK